MVDVMVFLGPDGWLASSLDPTGANLPRGSGPWTPLQLGHVTDVNELAALEAYGFHLVHRKEVDGS